MKKKKKVGLVWCEDIKHLLLYTLKAAIEGEFKKVKRGGEVWLMDLLIMRAHMF